MRNKKMKNIVFPMSFLFALLTLVACTDYAGDFEKEFGSTSFDIPVGPNGMGVSSSFDDGSGLIEFPGVNSSDSHTDVVLSFENDTQSSAETDENVNKNVDSSSSSSSSSYADSLFVRTNCDDWSDKKSDVWYLADKKDEFEAVDVSGVVSYKYLGKKAVLNKESKFCVEYSVSKNFKKQSVSFGVGNLGSGDGSDYQTFFKSFGTKDSVGTFTLNDGVIECGFMVSACTDSTKNVVAENINYFSVPNGVSVRKVVVVNFKESEVSSSSEKSSSSSVKTSGCSGDGWEYLYKDGAKSNVLMNDIDLNTYVKDYDYFIFENEDQAVMPKDVSGIDSLCVEYKLRDGSSNRFEMGYFDKSNGSVLWKFRYMLDKNKDVTKFKLAKPSRCFTDGYDVEICSPNDSTNFYKKINGFTILKEHSVKAIAVKPKSGKKIEDSKDDLSGLESTLKNMSDFPVKSGSLLLDFKDVSLWYDGSGSEYNLQTSLGESNYYLFEKFEGNDHVNLDISAENYLLKIGKKDYFSDAYVEFLFSKEAKVDLRGAGKICFALASTGPVSVELFGNDGVTDGSSLGSPLYGKSIYSVSDFCMGVEAFTPIDKVSSIRINLLDFGNQQKVYIRSVYTTKAVGESEYK